MNVELLGTQQAPQGPGLSDYVSVVKRRALHVLVPFLGLAAAGLGIAFIVPKEYQSITQVYIEDDMVGGMFTPVGFSIPHKHLLTTINQDIKRIEFLSPLVERYGITEGFNPGIPRERTKLYEKIRRRLYATIAPQKTGPDLVEFVYEGRDSVRVTEFVNAVRRQWQDEFMRRYGDAVKAVEANIRTVFEETLQTYTEAQTRLRNFQEANGSDYFGKDPGGQARATLAQLKTDLDNFELQIQGEQASLRTVLAQLEKVPAISSVDTSRKRSSEWTAQSLVIEKLTSEIALAKQYGYLETWPALKAKITQLEEEKRKRDAIDQWETDSIQQGPSQQWITLTSSKTQMESSIAALRDKSAKAKKRIEDLEKEVKVIPEKAAQAFKLQDAVFTAQASYEKAGKTRDAAKATRDRVIGKTKTFFRVVAETTPEEAKYADSVYPNYLLFTGLGAFIGLLIGGGIAFLSEFAAASFSTVNQVRYTLQVPVLGEISPLITQDQTRARKRRRLQILLALVILAIVITIIHVLWFDPQWRANLPPFIRDVMRRLYGGR
jgi:polysaccharide biosynthesis transport protein